MFREAWSVQHWARFDQKNCTCKKDVSNNSVHAWSRCAWQISLGRLCCLTYERLGLIGQEPCKQMYPASEHAASFPRHCWCWVLMLALHCRKRKVSAAMDKVNAVASEEQGDCLLGALNQGVTWRFPLSLDREKQTWENVYMWAYSETHYVTMVPYVWQHLAFLHQTIGNYVPKSVRWLM